MITIMRECASKAKSLENKNMSFVEVFEEISKSAKNAPMKQLIKWNY